MTDHATACHRGPDSRPDSKASSIDRYKYPRPEQHSPIVPTSKATERNTRSWGLAKTGKSRRRQQDADLEKNSVETGSKPPPVQPRLRFAPRGQALHQTDRLLRISSQALRSSRLGSAPLLALGIRSSLPRPVHERAAAAWIRLLCRLALPPPSPAVASINAARLGNSRRQGLFPHPAVHLPYSSACYVYMPLLRK